MNPYREMTRDRPWARAASGPVVRHRWIPQWRLRYWTVFLRHWARVGDTSSTVDSIDEIIEMSPPRWLWICVLLRLLGSRSTMIRAFAGRHFRAQRERLGLPRAHAIVGWVR